MRKEDYPPKRLDEITGNESEEELSDICVTELAVENQELMIRLRDAEQVIDKILHRNFGPAWAQGLSEGYRLKYHKEDDDETN